MGDGSRMLRSRKMPGLEAGMASAMRKTGQAARLSAAWTTASVGLPNR